MKNNIDLECIDLRFDQTNENTFERKIINHFLDKFNHKPKFLVKVPGRVNLIGEHVDYSAFPVISMAIEKYILFAVSFEKVITGNNLRNKNGFNQVNLTNVDYDTYTDNSFYDTSLLDNMLKPYWHHYIICGYKGTLERFNEKNLNLYNKISLNSYKINIAVSGNIPSNAGLSSSSAMVCASSITFEHVINIILRENTINSINKFFFKINKQEIANNCAKYERFIGTQGGGVDQAIVLLAETNCAKLIKFRPELTTSNISLPKNCKYFLAYCGKSLNKASTTHYNIRVFETKVACQIVLRRVPEFQSKKNLNNLLLYDLKIFADDNDLDIIELLEKVFNEKKVFTFQEIKNELNCETEEKLCELINFPLSSLRNIISSTNLKTYNFYIFNRSLHVFQEADRVSQLKLSENEVIDRYELGKLLNNSQSSLKNLYHCSSEELDKLVELSNNFGALGSKLTGAGWGGYIISVVPSEKVDNYYKNISKYSPLVFSTKPSEGALIYNLI